MPYKDRHNVKTITIQIPKNGEINTALQNAFSESGIAPSVYCRIATIEKLTREGYLPEREPEQQD